MRRVVVFTDLDGTLLDHFTYSFDAAVPALRLLKEKAVPLVICSSKTRKEIEYYREKLHNHHPFVSENGGGIFIPRGYFAFEVLCPGFSVSDENDYKVIRLGAAYPDLRRAMEELRTEGFPVKGFGDMAVAEVAELTRMSLEEAAAAKERDFDEPFIIEGEHAETPRLVDAIRARGFTHTRGRFHHLMGGSDKGKAVSILSELYRKKLGDISTIALGDSPNDLPMLEKADFPVLIEKPGGGWDPLIDAPNLIRADGVGPEGWNRAVLKLLQ
jgi:mannosyl-3-phosphoglycerate phosphatase